MDSWLQALALIFASALSSLATHHIPLEVFLVSPLFLPLTLCPFVALGEEPSPRGLDPAESCSWARGGGGLAMALGQGA